MDRRVLFATLILFAGGTAGVGVAVFAFVGLDDATVDTEIVWESDPAGGDDGTGAVVATVDGDPRVIQPATDGDDPVIRAIDADGNPAWTTPLPDGTDPGGIGGLVAGTLGGDPVVAYTSPDGELIAVNAADGAERFVVPLDGTGGIDPAFGDLRGDGTTELAAVSEGGHVLAVDASGTVVLETELDGDPVLRPLAVEGTDATEGADPDDSDTRSDGGLAVLTETTAGQTVSVVDANGGIVWSEPTDATALSWNAADTRRGGIVALGNADGTLTALEALDGSLRYEVGLQDVPIDVGDADAGRIHAGGTGDVWAVDLLDGEVVWKQQYGGETRVNAPGVADVTGDGTAEVVVVNRGGGVLAMNRNGEAVARGSAGDAVVYAPPLFADVTGDGTAEVLVVAEDGTVIALAV